MAGAGHALDDVRRRLMTAQCEAHSGRRDLIAATGLQMGLGLR